MPYPNPLELLEEEWRLRRLQALVREVSLFILDTDLAPIDIDIARREARQEALELFPDKEELYDMIYESRFDRLMDQFRPEG